MASLREPYTDLKKEDYEEPRCPLCVPTEKTKIPTGRVIQKLDEYLAKGDYLSAERHLGYWEAEAKAGGDFHGLLTVLNEKIGLLRKTNQKEKGLAVIAETLSLAANMGLEKTVVLGTTYLNAATGYKAFDMPNEALSLYEKAKVLYEAYLSAEDARLSGLYNNMAITKTALGAFGDARALFEKALFILEKNEGKQADMAITLLNLCDLVAAEEGYEKGEKKIAAYIEKAEALLDAPTLPRDGYYAFVCEKCAPIFGYYGYFLAEGKFKKAAEEIYAGH